MNGQRIVMVAGPGRCGSSAISGVLHQAGVNMGSDMIGPAKDLNPWGHFEDRDWHRLERELLINLASRSAFPPWIPELLFPDWESVAGMRPIDDITRDMANWIGAAKERSIFFGIKSTLWGLFYNHIVNLLPPDRVLVVVHRNWTDSVASRYRHLRAQGLEGSQPDVIARAEQVQSAMLWGVDLLAAGLRGFPIYHVDFDQVKADPKFQIALLLDWLTDGWDVTLDYGAAIDWIRPPDAK